MSQLAELGNLWNAIQAWLFPVLEDELGELDDRHREFGALCEICQPRTHLAAYRWVGSGCPPMDRLALCKAFIAKAVWDSPAPRCSVWVASGDQSPGPPEIDRFGTCPQAGQAEALKAVHSASDGESWSQVVYTA